MGACLARSRCRTQAGATLLNRPGCMAPLWHDPRTTDIYWRVLSFRVVLRPSMIRLVAEGTIGFRVVHHEHEDVLRCIVRDRNDAIGWACITCGLMLRLGPALADCLARLIASDQARGVEVAEYPEHASPLIVDHRVMQLMMSGGGLSPLSSKARERLRQRPGVRSRRRGSSPVRRRRSGSPSASVGAETRGPHCPNPRHGYPIQRPAAIRAAQYRIKFHWSEIAGLLPCE